MSLETGGKKSTAEKVLVILQIIAIVLAGFWAITTYFYENFTKPNEEPTYLSITSNSEIMGRKGSELVVKTSVLIKNLSKARTYIVSSQFIFTAYSISPDFNSNYEYFKNIKENFQGDRFPRFYEDKSYIVNIGKLIPDGFLLDPQEEFTNNFISIVKSDQFDVLRFFCSIYQAKEKVRGTTSWIINSAGTLKKNLLISMDNSILNDSNYQFIINHDSSSSPYNNNIFVFSRGKIISDKEYTDYRVKTGFSEIHSINELFLKRDIDNSQSRSSTKNSKRK